MPSSGGYTPPALSLFQLMQSDRVLQETLLSFARTGNSKSSQNAIMAAAQTGDVGAQLLLGEQYIPEQCAFEPDHDVPYCGKTGNEPPRVLFRRNPLGLEASYEDAARWLEKASAQGSGEASEVLAQLITRMQSNGHGTSYTAEDSARLHALARSQGFDVEPISATCYKLTPVGSGLSVEPLPNVISGESSRKPFTDEELAKLAEIGVSGSLHFAGAARSADSVLLMRPEGPVAHVRIILDHNPGHEVLLPLPAHRDVIYVQQGDTFVALPSQGPNLPRHVSLEPSDTPGSQILAMIQAIDGSHSGGFCTSFP
jgi:hypothetical protein